MEVTCEKCGTTYRLDESKISPKGTKVRCMKCKNEFMVFPPSKDMEDLDALERTQPIQKDVLPVAETSVEAENMEDELISDESWDKIFSEIEGKEKKEEIVTKTEDFEKAIQEESEPSLDKTKEEEIIPPKDTTPEPELKTENFDETPFITEEEEIEAKEEKAEPVKKAEEEPIFPTYHAPEEEEEKKRISFKAFALIILLLVIIGGGAALYFTGFYKNFFKKTNLPPFLLERLRGSEEYINGKTIYIIKGKIRNSSSKAKRYIQLQVLLFDKNGKIIKTTTVYAGKDLPSSKIKSMDMASLRRVIVSLRSTTPVKPKSITPFTAIFISPKGEAEDFQVKIVDAPNA
ncbi:MAG: zinc-ribbon domain-containing protein [Deltaproteobacteria bacterium]|nr:zinc-ribbon domain-containing protein [Deltaproteobacteria bacterium]